MRDVSVCRSVASPFFLLGPPIRSVECFIYSEEEPVMHWEAVHKETFLDTDKEGSSSGKGSYSS